VPLKIWSVSFLDTRGIRHGCDAEAETLYEAAVKVVVGEAPRVA
jgi:hypothetical protein